MRFHPNFLYLPASLLLLLASHTSRAESLTEDQSPAPWPKHARYWPEDPPHRRRDLEILEQHMRRGDQKVGVLKMSPDPGEKFYIEFWQYEENSGLKERNLRRQEEEKEEALMKTNGSAVVDYRTPFALHTGDEDGQELKIRAAVGRSAAALAALEKRDFTCPAGTNACSSIGYSNSCCPAAEDCFQIQDTGLGPVGCCPRGRTCSGTITSCASPNSACPQNLGGGCCLPNFVCQGVGCVINVITTVIISQTPSTTPIVITSTTSTSTSTFTPLPTTTSTTTVLSCLPDTSPCPVSLGGGCCHTDRVCVGNAICALPPGSSTSTSTNPPTSSPSSTITGNLPIRPTSSTATTTGPLQTTDCPVYFYACSAVYGGGCCQTGRDCAVTSCPPTASTTIINGSQTIVVPVGAAATTAGPPTGVCASGWATCAASLGGNCCPSGWECGTASCTATATASGAVAGAVEGKKSPSSGSGVVVVFKGGLALVGGLMVSGLVM